MQLSLVVQLKDEVDEIEVAKAIRNFIKQNYNEQVVGKINVHITPKKS